MSDKLREKCVREVIQNYDYYYLQAMHKQNISREPSVVIAGSSHAMNGVVEAAMDYPTINFSISSQDLYFDFVNLRNAVLNNSKIKICVINIGYYMLYQDISRSTYVSEMINRIYGPLFNEWHHLPQNMRKEKVRSDTNFERMKEQFAETLFARNPTYYGPVVSRKKNNSLLKEGEKWSELSDEQKDFYAKRRCEDHNHIKSYINSKDENEILISSFCKEMTEKGIEIVFAIFPFSKWYNKYIDPEYKEQIIKCLGDLPVTVHFLDMNDYDEMFEDEDFVNADHLDVSGAAKATFLLNTYLKYVIKES